MIYIYDILLNWNKDNLYEFFEWNKTDKLQHIKKIPLFRAKEGLINELINKDATIADKEFISKIYNQSEYYTYRTIEKIPYSFIVSDGITSLALKINKSGKILERSKLLLDEEDEVLCVVSKLQKTNLNIKTSNEIIKEEYLTRKEQEIKKYLIKELENSYKNREYSKIKYLYSEYSNKKNDNIKQIYNELIESINYEITSKHYNLYDLLQLTTNKN